MDREGKSGQGADYKPVRLGDLLGRDLVPARPGAPVETSKSSQAGNQGGVDALAQAAQLAKNKRGDHEFYSELNLNRFPFTSLYDKDTGKPGEIVVRKQLPAGETESVFEWIVSADPGKPGAPDYQARGLPGPFDRKVFRAIEKIVCARSLKIGEPLVNPQPIEIKEVLETLRLTVQTKNYGAVTRALSRLQAAKITCSGLVKGKGKTPARGANFSPISEILWAGTRDPRTGVTVHRTQIHFAQVYLDSVNSFQVRPIDWDLWLALGRRPLAQRLYEILEMRFFGLKDSPYAHFDYPELCQLLPTRPQKPASLAQQILQPAHEILKEVLVERAGSSEKIRLLADVQWEWDGPDGRLRYYPHREYMSRLRDRKPPEIDTRAHELAQEFTDGDSLAFYELVVRKVDWQYVSAARAEVRANKKVSNPGRYFATTLKRILKGVGRPVPFGNPE